MIPNMEPPITSGTTYRREYVEPLTKEDAREIDLIIALYSDRDSVVPPMKFRTEVAPDQWVTTLVYPKNLKRIFHADPISATTTRPDGLSNGERTSNG